MQNQGETGAMGDGVKFPERRMTEDTLLPEIIQADIDITRNSLFHRPVESMSTPAGLRGEGDRRNTQIRSLSTRNCT